MSILESQLETWSHQGATTASMDTYARVKKALEDPQALFAGKIEIYLQGSYRNSTNIYADSDVDIVAEYKNNCFYRDISKLPPDQTLAYHANHHDVTYNHAQFKSDIANVLRKHFGNDVQSGDKVFIVRSGQGRMTADILPAFEFRYFTRFYALDDQRYWAGIEFFDSKGAQIINYPKHHIDNGQAKNAQGRTNGWYKPTVRMFKKARNECVARGLISDSVAPSYFLECLLYNVPDGLYGTSYQDTYANVLNHLYGRQANTCTSQNELILLFGNSSVQWNETNAGLLLNALATLWNNW